MLRYTHICLDADDTLFDYTGMEPVILEKAFREMGYPYDDTVFRIYHPYNEKLWADFARGLVEKDALQAQRFDWLGKQLGIPVDSARLNAVYERHLADNFRLLPDSEWVCRRLYESGAVLVLTTNGTANIQYGRFQKSPLRPYFKKLFISDAMGASKPDPRYFDIVFEGMGNPDRSQVLMVGDSLHADMAGAAAYGIDRCWFNPRGIRQQQYEVTYEIDDLKKLLPIVLGEDK